MLWLFDTDRMAHKFGANRCWVYVACGGIFLLGSILTSSAVPEDATRQGVMQVAVTVAYYFTLGMLVAGTALFLWGGLLGILDYGFGRHVAAAEAHEHWRR